MAKIDFHVHVTPPEISVNWEHYAEKEPYFAMLSRSPHNKFASAEDIIAMLDSSGFDRAVIFGFAFKDQGLCRLVNDYVIEKVCRFPHRLTGFIAVSPGAAGMEQEIDRCYGAGLRGIGELFPEGQGFAIDNAQETRAFTAVCAERNLPVIIHVNEPVGHEYAGKTATSLKQVERFIENSNGLRIVLAHWGGGLFFYETMPELRKKWRNVWYDTAASPFLYDRGVYRAAQALGLCDKILFGTDFPLLPPSRYLPALEELPPPEQNRILGENAARLLAS